MTNDTKLIKYLIENKSQVNILAISKALKIDYKNTYTLVKRLENESLIQLERFGQSNRIILVPKVHPKIFQAEYERREAILKDKNFMVMLRHFKKSLKTRFLALDIFQYLHKRLLT